MAPGIPHLLISQARTSHRELPHDPHIKVPHPPYCRADPAPGVRERSCLGAAQQRTHLHGGGRLPGALEGALSGTAAVECCRFCCFSHAPYAHMLQLRVHLHSRGQLPSGMWEGIVLLLSLGSTAVPGIFARVGCCRCRFPLGGCMQLRACANQLDGGTGSSSVAWRYG